MCADPQVMRYFPAPLSRLESASLIGRVRGHFAEHGFGLWALERKDTGQFIGFTGLAWSVSMRRSPRPSKSAGAWRASTGAWATPAKRRGPLCGCGFDRLLLSEVVSFTADSNLPSQKVMQAIGMHNRPADDFEHPSSPSIIPCVTMCCIASAVNNGCKPCMDNLTRIFTMAHRPGPETESTAAAKTAR
jgi:RimJ/RimL family protein N-acetyltransferase